MNTNQERLASLLIRGNFTLAYSLSILTAILMATASIAGLAYGSSIYPAEELRRELVSTDVVNLCLGLPILLGSIGLARRGSLTGLLCWPGALFFVLYTYLIHVFAMPLNAAFLLHLALVTLSLYTLAGLVANIDGEAVQQRLAGAVPEKIAGVALAGQGLLNFAFVAGAMILPLVLGTPISAAGLANHITDVLITPAWFIGGVLLWRRRALGYVTGLGLLLQGSMFILSVILIQVWQSISSAAPLPLVTVAVVFSVGMVCFIPFALYARGVESRRSSQTV